jgi:hypothetical protein
MKKEIIYVLREEIGEVDLLDCHFAPIGLAVRDEVQAVDWVNNWENRHRSYSKVKIVDSIVEEQQ